MEPSGSGPPIEVHVQRWTNILGHSERGLFWLVVPPGGWPSLSAETCSVQLSPPQKFTLTSDHPCTWLILTWNPKTLYILRNWALHQQLSLFTFQDHYFFSPPLFDFFFFKRGCSLFTSSKHTPGKSIHVIAYTKQTNDDYNHSGTLKENTPPTSQGTAPLWNVLKFNPHIFTQRNPQMNTPLLTPYLFRFWSGCKRINSTLPPWHLWWFHW